MIAAAFSLVAAALGLYVALLARRFARAPAFSDQGSFAWVALTAAAFSAGNMLTTGPALADPVVADAVVAAVARAQLLVVALNAAAWLRYASAALGRPSPLDRPVGLALAAAGAAALVPGLAVTGEVLHRTYAPLGITYHEAVSSSAGDALTAAVFLVLCGTAARFAAGWRRGVPHAGLHAVAIAVLAALVLNDAAVFAGAWRGPYLVDLGFLVPLSAVAYALGSRVVDGARTLDRLRGDLEAQVQARTAELGRSEAARARVEKLAALGQLSAGVAHEVNNPAAILGANLRWLHETLQVRGEVGGADAVECVRESQQAVDRIARIVRQLLDASRLASTAGEPADPLHVATAAREAVRLARIRTGAAVIEVDVPAGLLALAHEPVLVQVLVNLVVNGAQAIPAGRAGHVTVRGARAGDRVRLLVEDDGTGMAPDTLRRVFEPFFSTKPFGAGTGLGLAVSRGLVASMGGDLRLESALGAGTRAVVELPAAPEGAAPAAVEAAADAPAGPRRTLLLVEDEPGVRAALRRLLEPRYDLTVAAGTDEGIALARTGRFDVVLCDVMMPEGGAERLAAALERDAPAAARRLVFLTAGATSPDARAFLADDPRPVLAKPLDVAELARVVERVAPTA